MDVMTVANMVRVARPWVGARGSRRVRSRILVVAAAVTALIVGNSAASGASVNVPRNACVNPAHCLEQPPAGAVDLSSLTEDDQRAVKVCLAGECNSRLGIKSLENPRWVGATGLQEPDNEREYVSEWFAGCDKAGLTFNYTKEYIAGRPKWHIESVGVLPEIGFGIGPLTLGVLGDIEWISPKPESKISFRTDSQSARWGTKARLHVTPLVNALRGSLLVDVVRRDRTRTQVVVPNFTAQFDDITNEIGENSVAAVEVRGEEVPLTVQEGQEDCGWTG
jgi:hypothetical protein